MRIKKLLLLLLFSFSFSSEWFGINSSQPQNSKIDLISSDIENSKIKFELSGFSLDPVMVNQEQYYKVKFPQSASIMELGYPDLPKVSSSIIIPDDKKMSINIIRSEFTDYENINVVPSKGNLSRSVDPNQIPFSFNESYNQSIFYPEDIVQLNEPYILRDFRGQVVEFHPIQYNPKSKTLRVFHSIEVEIVSMNENNVINPFERQRQIEKIDKEYKSIYNNHFLNFENENSRFDYLVDQGNMLIISDAIFMNTMQPLVDWKNKKGIPTEIVNVNTIGTNASSISSYVSNYYNSNGLTFLLLVGDIAQIPSTIVSGSASDVSYGCINGNDFYPEVIVGRFSGSSPNQIATQVERAVEYERNPQLNVEWYDNALSVASNQGPGFNGWSDDVFNDYLWNSILSDFTYDSFQSVYDGSGGNDSQGISAINGGVSLINYTGHGSMTSWGNGASLNTSQINQLTNNNQLPFVITVGCNVGEFNSTDACYAETWQRATNSGEPTGGIAHFGSTISQSWEPPMHGQYAMNLILTESYNNEITRTMGGITTNGCMYMNDAQGSSGINETKYWTFFGDPSTNLRTAPATVMNVQHDDIILIGASDFVVDIGENGALAALSSNGELIASAYSIGGVAVLNLGDNASTPGNMDLVVTGFNSVPYESQVMVLAPEGSYLMIDEVEVEYGLVDSGSLLYGRDNHLGITLSNVGTDSANNISISISDDSDFVQIVNNLVTYNNLIPNQTIELNGLVVNVDWNASNNEQVNLNFLISSNDDTFEITLPFSIKAPQIRYNSVTGTLNPGETTDLNMSLSNIGSAAINYPIVSLEGDSYVNVNTSGINNAYYWDYLSSFQGSNQEDLIANVTVSPLTPIGHIAEFTVHVNNLNGGLDISFPVSIAVGQIVEGFENDFSSSLNWEFAGNQAWQITDSEQYEGLFSAKSGDINDNQSSQISVELDVVMNGNIEFFYKVASEYSPSGEYFYDGLEFYIDNQLMSQFQPEPNGDSYWQQASFPVQEGLHTFTWSYVKDGGGGATDVPEDCAWIDYISFPPVMVENNGIAGDLNADGLISVLDVVQVINLVLSTDYNPLGDLNADSAVDVLDVILLVNLILG